MTKIAIFLLCTGAVSFPISAQPYPPSDKLPKLNTPVISYFQDGIEHYTDQGHSRFVATHCKKHICRLNSQFSALQKQDFTHSFGYAYRVDNARLQPMQKPHRIKFLTQNEIDLQYPKNQAHMLLKVTAIDVSGQKIAHFLKDMDGNDCLLSSKINPWDKFPPGSVAFAPVMRLDRNELIIPNPDVMTAQKSLDKFVATYSGKIPSCLRYERRPGAQPYAIRFKRHNQKGGQVIIYKADRSNIMCDSIGDPVAQGTYQRRRINGTNVMTFQFPNQIDSRDIGIKSGHKNAMEFALIEMNSPKKEVLPGRIIYANRDFYDYQYRFNKTAANAINQALK